MAYKKKKSAHRKNPKRVAADKKAAKTRARNKKHGHAKKRPKIGKNKPGHSKRRRSARMDGARCVACGHVVYGVGGHAPSTAKLRAHYKHKHPRAAYGWTAGLTAAQHKKFMKRGVNHAKKSHAEKKS